MDKISLRKIETSVTDIDLDDHTPNIDIYGETIKIKFEIEESELLWDSENIEIEVA
jgi:hypothetical protein